MEHHSGYGKWVAGKRSKWVTLIVWIMTIGVLTAIWPGVGSEEINNAPNFNDDVASVQAQQLADKEFPGGTGTPALLVWQREGGLSDEDLGHIQSLYAKLTTNPVPHQDSVPPFDKIPLPGLKAQLSEDQSTIVTPVLFSKESDSDQLKEGVEVLQTLVNTEFGNDPFAVKQGVTGELSARVTGPVGISIDATGLFKNADIQLMIATVLLVLVFLLGIYRSPILAFIPLIGVGFAYGVISPVLGFLASKGWITVDAQAISIMTVLLFGAGTDYCLFLISRFRQVLKEEENKTKALLKSITDSSGAIAMSGFTVVLALLALILAQYGSYHRFAAPFSIAIFIMGIASLTLVPALLAIIGRVSFWPFTPRTPQMEVDRAKKNGNPLPKPKEHRESWIGKLVVNKPWTVVIVTVVLLGTMALFSNQVKFTYDIMSSFPKDMASREGFDTIGKQFSPGELAPVKVMVDTEGKDESLGEKLAALPFVSLVSEPEQGAQNKNIVAYEVEFNMNPYSLEAIGHIPDIRLAVEQSLNDSGINDPADKVWISGQTATQYDTKKVGESDTRVIIPVVIGLITILLLLYLRSIVATLYLVGTVILSYLSALGLGWIILHYLFGVDAIQGSIPLYSFVFLVALGEDYNIFMISSIWSKSRKMPLKQAIKEGVGETSSVITSAGLILAGTFAVLATLPIQVLVQFGLITAVGVLLDTFIVRPFLVPAITMLCGRFAFWPGKYVEIKDHEERSSQG
ncbi:RND superfamily putative drug exporter [Paenibacillus sp. DS2015]|uniref:MMPL family transporter n=1 Tax=Paenibacillus sp. DS2015 TaxID=3373917 RepID=UPI003D245152